MRVAFDLTRAVALAALLLGCSDRPAPLQRAPGGETASPKVVRIVFDLPGDDIGGPEAQTLLEDVKAAILERKAGEILRAGQGMGEAEIVIQYERDEVLETLRRAIDAARPGAQYRIVFEER